MNFPNHYVKECKTCDASHKIQFPWNLVTVVGSSFMWKYSTWLCVWGEHKFLVPIYLGNICIPSCVITSLSLASFTLRRYTNFSSNQPLPSSIITYNQFKKVLTWVWSCYCISWRAQFRSCSFCCNCFVTSPSLNPTDIREHELIRALQISPNNHNCEFHNNKNMCAGET